MSLYHLWRWKKSRNVSVLCIFWLVHDTSCLLNIWVFKLYISRSLSYFVFFTLKNYCSSRTVYILDVHQFLLHSQYPLCHDFKMMIIIITITTIIIVTIIIIIVTIIILTVTIMIIIITNTTIIIISNTTIIIVTVIIITVTIIITLAYLLSCLLSFFLFFLQSLKILQIDIHTGQKPN